MQERLPLKAVFLLIVVKYKFIFSTMKNLTSKQIVFFFLFTFLGFLAMQVKLTNLAGSKVTFTLFDAFAPIAGAFLGPLWGVVSVLGMQLANIVFHGFSFEDPGTVIRLFPTLFGVLYFSRKTNIVLLVPLVAMIAFIAHPIGRTVWYYSLFWLIPIVCHVFRHKYTLARSLGATFTAHSVGGVLWIYAFNLPAAVWAGLIPIVAAERFLFAIGITVSYVAMKYLVAFLCKRGILDTVPQEQYLKA